MELNMQRNDFPLKFLVHFYTAQIGESEEVGLA